MGMRLINAPALLGSLLAATTLYASDNHPSAHPNSRTTLAKLSVGEVKYVLRANRMPRDQTDPNSSLNTPFRLELEETRVGEDRSIVRLSKNINLGHEQSLPTACIGLTAEKICLVLSSPGALWICLAERSASTNLDKLWEEEFSKMSMPKFDGINHPIARRIRQRMHSTSVPWSEIPGVTGEQATAAWKAGMFRPTSAEPDGNTWLIKFHVREKTFLGRYSEDKDGGVTWDARREN